MQEELVQGVPEDGDVYRSFDGSHVGNIDTTEFGAARAALHLQIKVGDVWYVYQLTAIEKIGEDNGVESPARKD